MVRIFAVCINQVKKVTRFSRGLIVAQITLARFRQNVKMCPTEIPTREPDVDCIKTRFLLINRFFEEEGIAQTLLG